MNMADACMNTQLHMLYLLLYVVAPHLHLLLTSYRNHFGLFKKLISTPFYNKNFPDLDLIIPIESIRIFSILTTVFTIFCQPKTEE